MAQKEVKKVSSWHCGWMLVFLIFVFMCTLAASSIFQVGDKIVDLASLFDLNMCP
jgi:hypothetical protein